MSFSSQMKEELSKTSNLANKEMVRAELLGYLLTNNTSVIKNKIRYATESEYNINRFHKILSNLGVEYAIELQGKVYTITFKRQEFTLVSYQKEGLEITPQQIQEVTTKPEAFHKAVVRGSFLGSGSLNNPNNTYHLEMLFSSKENVNYVATILQQYGIMAKRLVRKKSESLYMKEAEEISKFLAFVGANKAVLQFEEIRVMRDTRNTVNRLVNCETANINKTVNAAVEQINAIYYLKEKKEFEQLPENLKEIASLRLENQDASLIQLGEKLANPIGKSGVNHRLKKICEIAEELKKEKEE